MNGTFTRRIDDLGRIVIPKELRRTLRIKEGDELEILPDGDKLVLKRYSPFQDMQYASDGVAQMIRQHVGVTSLSLQATLSCPPLSRAN